MSVQRMCTTLKVELRSTREHVNNESRRQTPADDPSTQPMTVPNPIRPNALAKSVNAGTRGTVVDPSDTVPA